ncbi:MAG: Asp-tRNA(Asn)/Glu-tRNA(Gln) amidotransferase subunit GatB [Candidatus Omnitrophica bacterium]|nr:Asp-tRNA(Asn)/Glu-tRNA(Gln) amidotransferase subunit GatB [Candidatus Omnitrophota bacterium]
MKQYETVIGLEVHLQLNTKTKIFCGCSTEFGKNPNSQTCPICLGLPGTLPVLNKKVLEYAMKIGLALNCEINSLVKFDRKNYYYPDLPKAYQISQYDFPIAHTGYLNVKTGNEIKKIGITRAHMEEDAGKLIHDPKIKSSLVDYNRTGTPLVEIVSEPDMRSAQEAYNYLTTLKLCLQYLDVSDCDMEKGSLRCDANVSIREKGQTELGTKTELKNLNSFKAVKSSLEFEVARQIKLVESGERIIQETRLWDEHKQITVSMRSKEEAHDYRYFPEPDLVPFMVEKEEVEKTKKNLPESPSKKQNRFIANYELSDYDANVLVQDKEIADFFEECTKKYNSPKKVCNWVTGALKQELNTRKIDLLKAKLSSDDLIALIDKVETGVLSNLAGKDVLKIKFDTGKTIDQIINDHGFAQVSDDETLEKVIKEVIDENPSIIEQIKSGKESAVGFLVGQSMKKTQGKANPKKIGEMIKRRILND